VESAARVAREEDRSGGVTAAPAGLLQPTLPTERLLLRPFARSDAAAVQRLAGAREVAATTQNIPHPYPDGAAEAWIESHAPEYAAGRLATFAVTDRASSELLGAVGLTVIPEHALAELGYWMGVPYWGRGYTTEAARALMAFGFFVLGLNRIQARHFVFNPASGRVMQKLGLRREGVLRQSIRKGERFEDVVIHARLAEDGPVEPASAPVPQPAP
jgi:RimJ/RimL family protein N-acetyltransferase